MRGRAADALGRIGDAAAARGRRHSSPSSVVDSGALAGDRDRRSRAGRSRPRSRRSGCRCTRWCGSRRGTRWRPRCSTPPGSRSCGGGRSRTRCSASRTRAPLPALLAFAAGPGADAQAFAARGLGTLEGPEGDRRAAAPDRPPHARAARRGPGGARARTDRRRARRPRRCWRSCEAAAARRQRAPRGDRRTRARCGRRAPRTSLIDHVTQPLAGAARRGAALARRHRPGHAAHRAVGARPRCRVDGARRDRVDLRRRSTPSAPCPRSGCCGATPTRACGRPSLNAMAAVKAPDLDAVPRGGARPRGRDRPRDGGDAGGQGEDARRRAPSCGGLRAGEGRRGHRRAGGRARRARGATARRRAARAGRRAGRSRLGGAAEGDRAAAAGSTRGRRSRRAAGPDRRPREAYADAVADRPDVLAAGLHRHRVRARSSSNSTSSTRR